MQLYLFAGYGQAGAPYQKGPCPCLDVAGDLEVKVCLQEMLFEGLLPESTGWGLGKNMKLWALRLGTAVLQTGML